MGCDQRFEERFLLAAFRVALFFAALLPAAFFRTVAFFDAAFLVLRFLAVVFFFEIFLVADFLPEPLFLPPPLCLFTVAQARRSASPSDTPRFS